MGCSPMRLHSNLALMGNSKKTENWETEWDQEFQLVKPSRRAHGKVKGQKEE